MKHVDAALRQGPKTGSLAALLTATLAIILLELTAPVVMLQVYDRVVPNISRETLYLLIAGAVALCFVDHALRASRSRILGFIAAARGHQLACAAMSKVLEGDPRSCAARGAGENLAMLSAARALKEANSGYGLVTRLELGLVGLVLGLIAYIAGALAIVPAALLLAFALFSALSGRQLSHALEARGETDDQRFDSLIETLRALPTVKSLAAEEAAARRYEWMKLRSAEAGREVSLALTRGFDVTAAFSTAMLFGVLAAGSYMAMQGWITIGALIASVLLSGRIVQPLGRAMSLFARNQDARLQAAQATALFEVAPLRSGEVAAPGINRGDLKLEGATLLRLDGSAVVEGAAMHLRPGECVALTGSDAADRSEFMRLLAGLRPLHEGRLLLNGVDPTALAPKARVRQAALLQARPCIYRGTIMDNLSRFGETSLADVLYVARLLQIEDEVAALPRGLNTELTGSDSDPIPPGLRQQIALTRQLAPRPRLILFDDADAGLDRRGHAALIDLMQRLRGRATLLLSSTDPAVLELASRRFVLQDGRLSEQTEDAAAAAAKAAPAALRL